MKRSSYFTLAALPGVIGFLLILWGRMAGTNHHVLAGACCLVGAFAILGLLLYLRWQGWID